MADKCIRALRTLNAFKGIAVDWVSSDGNTFVVNSKKKRNIKIRKIIRNQAEDS